MQNIPKSLLTDFDDFFGGMGLAQGTVDYFGGDSGSSIWIQEFLNVFFRVATNLENLEYSGISLNIENSGNSQRILCNLGEKL